MKIWTVALMLGFSTSALADEATAEVTGDAKAGAAKVAVCEACHGAGGKAPSAPIFPSLAGQSGEYLASTLHAYRDGLRHGGMAEMMSPQAATLSDQDIADLAAYYSHQEVCATGAPDLTGDQADHQ